MKIYSLNSISNRIPDEKRTSPQFSKANIGGAANKASNGLKKIPRALMYVGQNDGEILNTLVTAGGTAIVAPIFIAGNPLSKEDSETKWYSAMRQPISAIIAMAFQIGINDAYNRYMKQRASLGRLGESMDLRAKPDSSYLRRVIKIEHPEYDAKQISEEIKRMQNIAEKLELIKLRKEMMGKEIKIDELIDIDALDNAKETMKKELEKQYQSEISGMNKKKKEKFLKPHLSDEKVRARAISDLEKKLEFDSQVKFEIRNLKHKFMNLENSTIDMAVKEIESNPKNLSEDVVKRIVEKLKETEAYEIGNDRKPFSSIPEWGGKNTIENVRHNVKVKQLLRVRTANAAKYFGKIKNVLGIVVSLVTLPFSCGLLNWAYPRVMEKVMPKLQPWIHRNDPDWSPEKAKKYGPAPKIEEKREVKTEEEEDDDDVED